jgi:hypothetical protein
VEAGETKKGREEEQRDRQSSKKVEKWGNVQKTIS